MGFIKNDTNEIVVDAVITKEGLRKLANGQSLNITRFALSDDEVDYALFNMDNPNGQDYFDSAITNMPLLESTIDDKQAMRYRVFTEVPTLNKPTVTYTLNVATPTDFESGISQANVNYAFTPNISPVPSDDASVYYLVTITVPVQPLDVFSLSSVDITGNVDATKGESEGLRLLRQQILQERGIVGSTPSTGSSSANSGASLTAPIWVTNQISKLTGSWSYVPNSVTYDPTVDNTYAIIVDSKGNTRKIFLD